MINILLSRDSRRKTLNWGWITGRVEGKEIYTERIIFCTDVTESQTTDETAQMRDSSDVITLKYCSAKVTFILSFSKKQMSRFGHMIKNTVIA